MTWIQARSRLNPYISEPIPLWHLDGVPWWEAKVPRRWHRCKPQTKGQVDKWGIRLIERCACGATRTVGDALWIEKNSRRRKGVWWWKIIPLGRKG